MKDNYYLVKLRVHCGEYQKQTIHFVKAESEQAAQYQAIQNESHDPDSLEYDSSYYSDMCYEFLYKVETCKHITDSKEVEVLKKYL